MSRIKRSLYPEIYETLDQITDDTEEVSNCCGASMEGEPTNNWLSYDTEGRCSECKEMAGFNV